MVFSALCLAEMDAQESGDSPDMDEDAAHKFRSTLAKVRWPVNHVVPDLAYPVSSLAQVSLKSLDWEHVRKLNLVVRTLKKMGQGSQAEIVLPR